jgi:hypothetical protein
MKHTSWNKNTLGFRTTSFGNALSVTSTYPKLLVQIKNLLNYSHIYELQQQDAQLLALPIKNPNNYINLQLDDNVDDIICHKKDPGQPKWKIALPKAMVVDTIKWFHQVM